MEKWCDEMADVSGIGLVGMINGEMFQKSIPIAAPDKNTKKRAMQIINEIDCVGEYDAYLYDIIWREISAYITENGKSAEEAAATIQSRASIYLSEQYG